MAKRKKKAGRKKTGKRKKPVLPVVVKKKSREKVFNKGEMYRINVPGAKGYGVFQRVEYKEGRLVHVFQSSMEPHAHFHIPADRVRGIYKMATATDWKKFSEVRCQRQRDTVRKYKLFIADRTLLLNRGIKHGSRELESIRTQKAVEKLLGLGLLQRDAAGYSLTPEGLAASHKIFSSSSEKKRPTMIRQEDACESQAYSYGEYMKLLERESHVS